MLYNESTENTSYSIIQLMINKTKSETKPASGMIINIVNKPISSKVIVGVTMISIELGIILCRRFSTMLNNQTAKITPIIPPCPAARCFSSENIFNWIFICDTG